MLTLQQITLLSTPHTPTPMRQIITMLLALLALVPGMAASKGQHPNTNTMETRHLSPRQQSLVIVAALAARGDIEGLKSALHQALDNGLALSEAHEALSPLYAYTGFPRSLNALGALQQVVALREHGG